MVIMFFRKLVLLLIKSLWFFLWLILLGFLIIGNGSFIRLVLICC